MGNFFGKNKEAKTKQPDITANDKAVLELKRQRDQLKKYKIKLESVRQREIEVAKSLLAEGHKKRALLALKKKKNQEKMLEKAEGQLFNLEELIASVVDAAMQKQVFEALEAGKNTLEALNNEISVEEVEALMEESAEAIARRNEISEAMGSALTSEDEAAIEEELAGLLDDEEQDGVTVEDIKSLPEASKPIQTSEERVSSTAHVPKENSQQKAVAKKKPVVVVA